MLTRRRRFLYFVCLGLATSFFLAGGRIYAKAQLAQVLLHRAWAKTQRGANIVKPWPWADTWPVARLRAPAYGVDVIVLSGASGRTMAFGPGHLSGTALPGRAGNSVLAGHRDTSFRFLPNLASGDELVLETPDGSSHSYRVTETLVVDQKETWVVEDTRDSALTLITCFPFDAVVPGGPLRYVVKAERSERSEPGRGAVSSARRGWGPGAGEK